MADGGPPFPKDNALTELDRQVLKECGQESFYKRVLPLGAGFVLFTFYNHRRGKYKQFIALRYLGAAIAGNILGRASYVGECRKKFENLDESQSSIKAMLSKRKPQNSPFEQPGQEQQQQKRDISLDNQEIMPGLSPRPQQPPSSRPRQDDFGSFPPPPGMDDQQFQRPRVYDDLDDAAARRQPRMWDEDYKKQDS